MMLPQNKAMKTLKASIIIVCQNMHLIKHLIMDSLKSMPILSKLENPKDICQFWWFFFFFIFLLSFFSCHLLYDNSFSLHIRWGLSYDLHARFLLLSCLSSVIWSLKKCFDSKVVHLMTERLISLFKLSNSSMKCRKSIWTESECQLWPLQIKSLLTGP